MARAIGSRAEMPSTEKAEMFSLAKSFEVTFSNARSISHQLSKISGAATDGRLPFPFPFPPPPPLVDGGV